MAPARLASLLVVAASSIACLTGGPGCNRGTPHGGTETADGWEGWETAEGESAGGGDHDATTSRPDTPAGLLRPEDLEYRGAFRLPQKGAARDADSWHYAGQAFTYRPDGDPRGGADGYPGSLIGAGHDVLNHFSEVSIPAPVRSRDLRRLPVAKALQPFRDVRGRFFRTLVEVVRVGVEFVPRGPGRSRDWVYVCWGAHFQEEGSEHIVPPIARISPDLSRPSIQGAWWVDRVPLYSTNGYLLTIPEEWARSHTGGRTLGVGRFRDGGWSGRGPVLHAIAPWLEGDPPRDGTRLRAVTLLQYSRSSDGERPGRRLRDYRHSDEWNGGAWIETPRGTALLFVGTKGSGYTWYGWASPRGDGQPCIEGGVTDSETCYQPDGSRCPGSMHRHCRAGESTSYRGWWSSRWDAQFLFYDPADLARVAAGTMPPHEPQPYATLDVDRYLLLPETTVEPFATGRGNQRRFRLGEPAYDSARGLVYVPERFADGAQPVIHVFSAR